MYRLVSLSLTKTAVSATPVCLRVWWNRNVSAAGVTNPAKWKMVSRVAMSSSVPLQPLEKWPCSVNNKDTLKKMESMSWPSSVWTALCQTGSVCWHPSSHVGPGAQTVSWRSMSSSITISSLLPDSMRPGWDTFTWNSINKTDKVHSSSVHAVFFVSFFCFVFFFFLTFFSWFTGKRLPCFTADHTEKWDFYSHCWGFCGHWEEVSPTPYLHCLTWYHFNGGRGSGHSCVWCLWKAWR